MSDIAVIGMAGSFPGSPDIRQLWINLLAGREGISFFPDEDLVKAGVSDREIAASNYVKAFGKLEDIESFDADFFGYTPREAAMMDPQHRLFLQTAWHALEDAACNPQYFQGSIGVFGGAALPYYLMRHVMPSAGFDEQHEGYQAMIGNDKDFLSTRVAYKLKLKGPAISVQTACSTSLVAIHLACQSLLSGECDMALAGGVSIALPQDQGYRFQQGMIFSPDGHCRAFDAEAGGTVAGNGVGVVVLKPVQDAIDQGDHIYCVIKASAINNDGAVKVGYTAPSVEGQVAVISEALAVADVNASGICFVEAHGTATNLGDPIEVAALSRAYRAYNLPLQECAIGSVKTNIGHLNTAAGVAGFIKAALSIHHRLLPPSLHFKSPNPDIRFSDTPFFVNTEVLPLKGRMEEPIRGAVSSFGIGGTNAHLILEEAPHTSIRTAGKSAYLLSFSAKSKTALDAAILLYLNQIKSTPEARLSAQAYTLGVGRLSMPFRRFVVADSIDESRSLLQAAEESVVTEADQIPEMVWLFPGQGSQYAGMVKELYDQIPLVKEVMDSCAAFLLSLGGYDIREIIFDPAHESILNETRYTQPALFCVSYSLARWWMSLGLKPGMMLGHSIGEYTAACLAGVFSLEDALWMIDHRARLMQSAAPGSMLAVSADEAAITPLLNEFLELAAVNAPGQSVVAGHTGAIQILKNQLAEKGIASGLLQTSHAFHSFMMDGILNEFGKLMENVQFHEPNLPFISNITGRPVVKGQVSQADYWVKQVRSTVRFSTGVTWIKEQGFGNFLEIGPGLTLSSIVRQHFADRALPGLFSSIPARRDKKPAYRFLLHTLGQLWQRHLIPDLYAFFSGEPEQKVSLPGYVFSKDRYWIDPAANRHEHAAGAQTGSRLQPSQWLYLPAWKRQAQYLQEPETAGLRILFFCSQEDEHAGQLIAFLDERQAQVIRVEKSVDYYLGQGKAGVHPSQKADFVSLFNDLRKEDFIPTHIIYSWQPGKNWLESEELDVQELVDSQLTSLLFLAQALGEAPPGAACQLTLLTKGAFDVLGNEPVDPVQYMLLSPLRIIGQENPNVTMRLIDLQEISAGSKNVNYFQKLSQLLFLKDLPAVMAFRSPFVWLPVFEQAVPAKKEWPLRDGGVYLITGGTGGIGLELMEALSGNGRTIVLLSRKALPARKEWPVLLEKGKETETLKAIQKILNAEARGTRVVNLAADLTQEAEMEKIIGGLYEDFGQLHGVIHAAGLAGGGAIQQKRREDVQGILSPKVKGAVILHKHLLPYKLDFFVLISSLTSQMGGFGQWEYAAANLFLDGFAFWRSSLASGFTMSINWDMWKESGMVANLLSGKSKPVLPRKELSHPLLHHRYQNGQGVDLFVSYFSSDSNWFFEEHVLLGRPAFPGSAYLELITAVFKEKLNGTDFQISEISFLQPFTLAENEWRELNTEVYPTEEGYRFVVLSRSWGEKVKGIEHAHGLVTDSSAVKPEPIVPDLILNRIKAQGGKEQDLSSSVFQEGLIEFGPRWENFRQIFIAPEEGLALIDLGEPYRDDLNTFLLHPALLDAATGFLPLAGRSMKEYVYLPYAYKGFRQYAPLSAGICSQACLLPDLDGGESIRLKVTVYGADGLPLASVDEFILRRVLLSRFRDSLSPAGKARRKAVAGKFNFIPDAEAGISNEEGRSAFLSALALQQTQVLVSVSSLEDRLNRETDAITSWMTPGAGEYERPLLDVEYKVPQSEMEKDLAAIWSSLLGINAIGVDDDFFQLGGHSLLVTQVLSRIKEKFKTDIPISAFYETPTIADLATQLENIIWIRQMGAEEMDFQETDANEGII